MAGEQPPVLGTGVDDTVTEATAVAAHRLLGSSAVVFMGIGTLLHMGDRLPPQEQEWLLHRMADHASIVDNGLKHLAQGQDPGTFDLDAGDGHHALSVALVAQHLVVSELAQAAIELGAQGTETDEAAVELLAFSGRNRTAVEMAMTRCRRLPPGQDVDRAVTLLREAVRVGDLHDHWLVTPLGGRPPTD